MNPLHDKRWITEPLPCQERTSQLSKDIHTSLPITRLLVQRGITTYKQAKSYFRPDLSNLYDPYLLKDMHKAVKRIAKAFSHNEKILIYGDYDVDGTTSVALVYGYLSKYYSNLSYYIPDRYTEGYGLSLQAIQWAKQHDIQLIITLDCGIKAFKPIEVAHKYSIDVIITDHHQPGASLPNAYAIINPSRRDCDYPCKHLSGCAVGFKLLQALAIEKKWNQSMLTPYLQLVAISIAADIVPMLDENRVLTHHGLIQLKKFPFAGITALLQAASLTKSPTISHLVFGIAPRINAAGRIEHAHLAVELLLTQDPDEAEKLTKLLEKKNTERKTLDKKITREALDMIKFNSKQFKHTTVLYKEEWHKGVIGIVASRCIEHHYRPTIILTQSNGKAVGSARSVHGYNVYKAIQACEELLEQFGGHTYAAGLTLTTDKVEAFKKKFEDVVTNEIKPELLIPLQKIDLEIQLDEITPKMFQVIQQMAPFGPGNMKPVFFSSPIEVINYKLLKEKHLKLFLKQKNGEKIFEAVGFNMSTYFSMIKKNNSIQIAYQLDENEYLGIKKLQLYIKDIKPLST